MTESFNQNKSNQKINKDFYPYNFIFNKVGFFGDNSSVNYTNIENSPRKINNGKSIENFEASNIRLMNTNENTIYNTIISNNNLSNSNHIKEYNYQYPSNEVTSFSNNTTNTKNILKEKNQKNGGSGFNANKGGSGFNANKTGSGFNANKGENSKKINGLRIKNETLIKVNPFKNLLEEIETKNKINYSNVDIIDFIDNQNEHKCKDKNKNKEYYFEKIQNPEKNYFNNSNNFDIKNFQNNNNKEFNQLVNSVKISSSSFSNKNFPIDNKNKNKNNNKNKNLNSTSKTERQRKKTDRQIKKINKNNQKDILNSIINFSKNKSKN
jgi:hypothetical protein